MNRTNARSLAVRLIAKSLKDARLFEDDLHALQNRHRLPDAERRLLEEIAFGTMRRRLTIECVVQHFLKTRLRKLEPYLQASLLIGSYQILFLHKVPFYAAVDATVETVKGKSPGAVPLLNAVLRRIVKTIKRKSSQPLAEKTDPQRTLICPKGFTLLNSPLLPSISNPINYLSVQYSVSEFIVEKLLRNYGERLTERILKASITPPPLTIRTNTLKTTRSELRDSLKESAIKTHLLRHPAALTIKYSSDVTRLAQYKRGWFYVQDEGAMYVADALLLRRGMDVLDACAAPGGKTAILAETLRNEGFLLGVDINFKRLIRMKENLKRGEAEASLLCADSRYLLNLLKIRFDRILLDVPCSNSGVLRRRMDARYRLNSESLKSLVELQDSLLEGVAPLLKRNGILLYATCSLLKEENEERVDNFLAKHPDFSLIKKRLYKPKIGGWDGFFYAQLKRTE